MKNFEKFDANKYMMEPTMTKEEIAEATELENADVVKRIHFWAKKYHQTTGADHIKCLVSNISFRNLFVFCLETII